jgi:hypothetical protein
MLPCTQPTAPRTGATPPTSTCCRRQIALGQPYRAAELARRRELLLGFAGMRNLVKSGAVD